MEKIMKELRENIGTITTVASILLMWVGSKTNNYVFMIVGAYAFVKRTGDLSKAIRKAFDDDAKLKDAQAHAIRTEADLKAELLAKAYQDGKISNDDISLLVRSLAVKNEQQTQTVVQPTIESNRQRVEQPQFRTVIDVKSTPVVEEKVDNTTNESTSSSQDGNVIHYSTENGRFKFEYNGQTIAFSPLDIVKGSALHEEFDDSIGYYKNGEAVFYIYPVDKTIVAVPF